jgi:hypothetical protein
MNLSFSDVVNKADILLNASSSSLSFSKYLEVENYFYLEIDSSTLLTPSNLILSKGSPDVSSLGLGVFSPSWII